jgi:uncharacterized membrane protein YciS (DUF1049 family)
MGSPLIQLGMEPMEENFAASNSEQRRSTVLPVIFALYVVVSAAVMGLLYYRLTDLDRRQTISEDTLRQQISETHKELKTSTSSLAQQVGTTEQKLSKRAAELAAEERKTQQKAQELAASQQKQEEAIGSVSTAVTGVKSEVGGVKQDVSKTQSDLAATQVKLDHTIGDLGIQTGLVAHTRDDLEFLKHKGDRNYYEFTVLKGKHVPVSTVSLELKKADAKHGRYTLNVLSDDKKIEKKDRNMNEPIQFYTGRDRMLYELVVLNIDKDKISGYISTPKNAPLPVQKEND